MSLIAESKYAASTRQLLHYLQLLGSGEFRQYDYDSLWKNEAVYGQRRPPLYDLGQVTAPTIFHLSKADQYMTAADISVMASQLPNFLGINSVPSDDFQHSDFILSTYVRELLNEKVISTMKGVDERYANETKLRAPS